MTVPRVGTGQGNEEASVRWLKSHVTALFFFLLLLLLVTLTGGQLQPCGDAAEDSGVRIHNLTTNVTFQFDPDLTDHDLSVTYEWDVDLPQDVDFDGFLYRLLDTDEVSLTHINQVGYGGHEFMVEKENEGEEEAQRDSAIEEQDPNEAGEDDCGFVHVTLSDGSYGECAMPCTEVFGGRCETSSMCNYLKQDYKSITKNVRSLRLPALFGRHYEFTIVPYASMRVDDGSRADLAGVSVFCGHHLIEEVGVGRERAYEFCSRAQEISDLSVAAGPPTDLSVHELRHHFLINRVSITIRWRAPHDIAGNKSVTRFLIKDPNRRLKFAQTMVVAKSAEEARSDPFYYLDVDELRYGREYMVQVTSYVDRNGEMCHGWLDCEQYGTQANLLVKIDDIDACALNVTFCDRNTTCADRDADDRVAATCQCVPGYEGDGVAVTEGGTGCRNYNACLPGRAFDRLCSPVALCRDHQPPDLSVNCTCPDGYVGDGYLAGSGCRDQRLVVSLGVAIPLSIVASCVIVYVVWKYKKLKERKLDLKFSKFFPSKPDLMMMSSNQQQQQQRSQQQNHVNGAGNSGSGAETQPVAADPSGVLAALGKKWEISVKRLTITDTVLGRGNFGIVRRATLKNYDSGDDGQVEKVVAVKSLTGVYATVYRADFLAEINLMISIGRHDHVLGVLGVCSGGEDAPLLVTELMEHGDLLHVLWNARDPKYRAQDPVFDFTERSVYEVGRQVASGLEFLSSWRIIHGDVAARNVLVGEGLRCKISDFGLANDVYRYGLIREATERRVPFKWISPERMRGGEVPITLRSDQWSFGILLYEMSTLGSAPYPGMRNDEIFEMLKSGARMERPVSCSAHLYSIMLKCWEWNARDRPSFKQLQTMLTIEKETRDENPSVVAYSNHSFVESPPLSTTTRNHHRVESCSIDMDSSPNRDETEGDDSRLRGELKVALDTDDASSAADR